MIMHPTLSKSKYVKGLQCPKALWLDHHRRDLKPKISAATQAMFDSSNEVGALAQAYFPGGIEVITDYFDIKKAEALTGQYITAGFERIYEATAIHPEDGSHSRIDILRKAPGVNKWDLIEVKSSTSLKDYHLDDLSLQYHVFSGAGYTIDKCFIMVLDRSYVRHNSIDPQCLFKLIPVTDQVKDKHNRVIDEVRNLNQIIQSKNEPNEKIGARCNSPFVCDYKSKCWRDVPEYSVFDVFAGSKADKIVQQINSYEVADIFDDLIPKGKKAIDIESYKAGKVHINQKGINGFLSRLKYPLYYLDYETVGPAVPVLDKTSPYAKIPFQFSLHVQQAEDGELEHFKFLHKDRTEPRKAFSEALIGSCGQAGSIIVYNQSFEASCNIELAKLFPQYKDSLLDINNRMVDLLIPFRTRLLYNPVQKGSASIKDVLPSFSKNSYSGMDISDGLAASRHYQAFLEGRLTDGDLDKLWEKLELYCKQDTFSLVVLLKALRDYV
tara:strand:- start:13 stop:1500 length:1488 start_codon:yes stop_codon:yes gene_type:complete